jgi:hypothetical protein
MRFAAAAATHCKLAAHATTGAVARGSARLQSGSQLAHHTSCSPPVLEQHGKIETEVKKQGSQFQDPARQGAKRSLKAIGLLMQPCSIPNAKGIVAGCQCC